MVIHLKAHFNAHSIFFFIVVFLDSLNKSNGLAFFFGLLVTFSCSCNEKKILNLSKWSGIPAKTFQSGIGMSSGFQELIEANAINCIPLHYRRLVPLSYVESSGGGWPKVFRCIFKRKSQLNAVRLFAVWVLLSSTVLCSDYHCRLFSTHVQILSQ